MQFHLNGFRVGDPDIANPADPRTSRIAADVPPAEVDVLIVGCGPAGLTLAAQLAVFPGIVTRIVDQRPGPLELGQADGIACRTMEMFNAFGFVERVLRESYWVNETTFWKPDYRHRHTIVRSGRIQDTEDGLSEFPHVILNQARVHDFYLDQMRNAPTRLTPDYARRMLDLKIDGDADYPVTVQLEQLDPERLGETETIRARYVIGADGARSMVRRAIGRELVGDSANQAWGVMDVLAVTDFPDIRLKSVIHSSSEGSVLIIPREGGYLVRLYIELDKLRENERVSNRNVTEQDLIAAAQRILHPYKLEVKEIAWWSVYEIGQRLCDRFDNLAVDGQFPSTFIPSVFILGDACHTHSPKAGQGMNVSMQDAFNLGWKLASVLQRQSSPEILRSYSAERQAIAAELIAFDRAFAKMFSTPPKDAANPDGIDPADFQDYFIKQARFTAGTATQYAPSILIGAPTYQALAKGFPIGMRFHSAPVIRLADAKPIHLGHVIAADGRWRLMVFAGDDSLNEPSSAVRSLCHFLSCDPASPIMQHTPGGMDVDAVFDVRAVFQQDHRALDIKAMPDLLLPRKGTYGLIDYEKIFCADGKRGEDIFALRGIDRQQGCVVIVRPDQYVAQILPISAHAELTDFFGQFMTGISTLV